MLRATLCTLAALSLSACVLVAAEPKGGAAGKPYTATLVKVDAAKHLLIVKSKTPAGKDVLTALTIKDGVKLPNTQPGSTFTVVEEGGKVIALQPIPTKPAYGSLVFGVVFGKGGCE